MRYAIRPILVAVLSGLLTPAALAQAPVVDSANLSARLQRVERTLSSSSLLQLAQNIQALQREIRELRGELELQSRDISRLRKRQRDLYLDIDKRLQAMAQPAIAATPAVNPAPTLSTTNTVVPASQPATSAAGAQPSATATSAQSNQAAPINASATPAVPATPATASASTPVTPPAAAPTPATADPANEQQAYRQAFDLLKSGKFDEAANALQGFLKNYPNGRFADNAQYWLGEAYYVSRKFDPALTAFERLLVDYPNSPKRSHAMLKIGFIHDEAGRKPQAKQILSQLIQRYPQSTAAGLAKKRLSRLQ